MNVDQHGGVSLINRKEEGIVFHTKNYKASYIDLQLCLVEHFRSG